MTSEPVEDRLRASLFLACSAGKQHAGELLVKHLPARELVVDVNGQHISRTHLNAWQRRRWVEFAQVEDGGRMYYLTEEGEEEIGGV